MIQDLSWRDREKKTANRLYEKARLGELQEVVNLFKTQAAAVSDPDQLWNLIEEMMQRRREFEQKYQYRYSILITLFSRLLAEDRISESDLQEFDREKIEAIIQGSTYFRRRQS